jgi:hypothetical protein
MAGAGTTVQRGYGVEHQQERQRWRPLVEAGHVACWRCGWYIHPAEPWDLGHDDDDRSMYRGPEHRSCNRRAGAERNRSHRRPACWCGGRCRLHIPLDQV